MSLSLKTSAPVREHHFPLLLSIVMCEADRDGLNILVASILIVTFLLGLREKRKATVCSFFH